MHETARQLKAQLDSKMSALLALIAEADRAASRLEAAANNSENIENSRPSKRPPSGGTPLFAPKPGPQPREDKKTAALPSSQAPALQPAPAAAPRHHQKEIYALADGGLNGSTIAQRLAIPVGEVELVLSLRSNR